MNVAVEPQALTDFIATTTRLANVVEQHRDGLARQRPGVVGWAVVAPPGRAIPALGDLVERWRQAAIDVGRVRDAAVAADAWPGVPALPLLPGQAPTPEWAPSDVERMVALGRERARLRADRAAGGAVDRLAAGRELGPRQAEMVELAAVFDRAGWQAVAHLRAGFDAEHWDPARGLAHNDANVRAVYTFYGDLYLEDRRLQWAGLAALVGRRLYAGWQDLHTGRLLIDHADRIDYVSALLGLPPMPGVVHRGIDALTVLVPGSQLPVPPPVGDDLESLETDLLTMVPEIFDDMSWMHVAFLYGGPAAVATALGPDGEDDPVMANAWVDIASGDTERIRVGSRVLAYREQLGIIGDNWDALRDSHPFLTLLLSNLADNPVPGGSSFRERYPTEIVAPRLPTDPLPFLPDSPRPGPAAAGDISVFADRWRYFTEVVEPSYHHLVTEQPDQLVSILQSPIDADVGARRLHPLPYRARTTDIES